MYFLSLIINPTHLYAEESLKSIQNILKNDFLEKEMKEKQVQLEKERNEKKIEEDKTGYNYPTKNEIFTLLTQLWLVKNSTNLHWDFKNAHLGIMESVKNLFVKLGIIDKKINILIIDNPKYAHGALPYGQPLNSSSSQEKTDQEELFFFLSLPFIRSMDLSTLEISMIILEDYFRIQLGIFKNYIIEDESIQKLGTNFYGQFPDVSFITTSLDKYNQFFQLRGYKISEENLVFKSMKNILQIDEMKLLLVYQETLKKINELVTTNTLYSYYTKWYPSPYIKLTSWVK